MKKSKQSLLTATLTAAILFIFSCGEVGNDNPDSEQGNSSSSFEAGGGGSSSSLANASSSSVGNTGGSSSSVGSSSNSVCNGVSYDPQTQRCNDNTIEIKCGVGYYITKTQFCSNGTIKTKDTFTDDRDGQTYTYVVIGSQTWMAENLNYATRNSNCYKNTGANCATHGKLYTWLEAMGFTIPNSCKDSNCYNQEAIKIAEEIDTPHQGVCPEGWHIPTDGEWQTLVDFASDGESCYVLNSGYITCQDNNAGKRLKAASGWTAKIMGYNEWIDVGRNTGTDDYGFAAMGSGYSSQPGTFDSFNEQGLWWSATLAIEFDITRRYCPYHRSISSGIDGVHRDWGYSWTSSLAIRCLKDFGSDPKAFTDLGENKISNNRSSL